MSWLLLTGVDYPVRFDFLGDLEAFCDENNIRPAGGLKEGRDYVRF